MLFSLQWLRELCPVDAPDDEVVRAITARGLTVDSVEERGDDRVLDIDIPANRGDCLGHLGVAREVSAAFGVPLAPRPEPVAPDDGTAAATVRVEIDAPEGCRRFTATILRGVKIAPSSSAVEQRLEACGVRSINNVVDASNLVMLETGNPVHFYDLREIHGGRIVARQAADGETLTTIDEIERKLDARMLVIADDRQALGVAGVMGGAGSEIGDDTSDVLIEVAWFDPVSIRRTARDLGMKTEASHRFERCVDPEGTLAAQALARKLLSEAGGTLEGGLIDCHPAPAASRKLTLREDQIPRLLGFRPSEEDTRSALDALGLAPEVHEAGVFEVTVPSWRSDLEREADLVEEVARHIGYDRIPEIRTEMNVDPGTTAPSLADPCRELLAGLGFHEAYGYAMIADGEDAPFVPADSPAAVRIANPIAETMAVMRRSLLPGLIRSAERNVRRGVRDVRLFEIENVFRDVSQEWLAEGIPTGSPAEPEQIALSWTGAAEPRHWSAGGRDVDLYDALGVVDSVIGHVAPELAPTVRPEAPDGFHPGRCASWFADGKPIARCGQLHPARSGEIDQPLYLAEIDLSALAGHAAGVPRFHKLPKLGSVARDLAVVLPADRRFSELLDVLSAVESPVPATYEAVDRYAGPPLADGESSVTIRATLQPWKTTLTEEQIEGFRQALVAAISGMGLQIRS